MIFSLIFGLEAIVETINAIMESQLSNLSNVDVAWVIFSFILFLLGLDQMFIKGKLIINKNSVLCKYKHLFGNSEWNEPMNNYKGLIRKKELNRASGAFDQIVYTIWLIHKNKKKNVKIYKAWSNDGIEKDILMYQEMLGLPEVIA